MGPAKHPFIVIITCFEHVISTGVTFSPDTGPINVLHDLNVGKRPGSVQCLNMSSSDNEGGPWEIRIGFQESTFVKSVGIFNDDGQYQGV